MLIYAAEPPPTEDRGDGEDTREWFSRKADALKRYMELKKQGVQYLRFDARMRAADSESSRNAWREHRDNVDPGWLFTRVALLEYQIDVSNRHALVAALRSGFRSCETQLALWHPGEEE